MSVFVFKEFEVRQERSAMKIGTDSILLGCLCEPGAADRILDIGTGTGVLALMMAQRSKADIVAVEPDADAAQEAEMNFRSSKWKERLQLVDQTIQQFATHNRSSFDLIISNPPYFRKAKNYAIGNVQRSNARHDEGLPFEQLAEIVPQLLNEKGSFWLILPVTEAAEFKTMAGQNGLFLSSKILIIPKPGKTANRVIMQWTKQQHAFTSSEFIVYDESGHPTDAYKKIASGFYTGAQFR